jgi:hypothetical protein
VQLTATCTTFPRLDIFCRLPVFSSARRLRPIFRGYSTPCFSVPSRPVEHELTVLSSLATDFPYVSTYGLRGKDESGGINI